MNPLTFVSALMAAGALLLAPHAWAQSVRDLVAPIAFYPDALVAQVLVAATHPDEIAQAERWLDGERPVDERELAQAVDGQEWSPGIKALALVRPVLRDMQRNLAWATQFGEAYEANPAQVLRAVQAARQAALADGELTSASGQRVTVRGALVLLEPVDPRFVYVPGAGVFDVGAFERFAWGWHGWQINWRDGFVMYQDAPYVAALQAPLRP